MDPYDPDPYEASGGTEEDWDDSPPASPPPQRRAGAAATQRSPSPSASHDAGSHEDDLPEFLARLCVFRDEIGYVEPRPPSPPLWEPAPAAAAAGVEEEEQPPTQVFHTQLFGGLPPGPEPEQQLAERFRGLLQPAVCLEVLEECGGNLFEAHRTLRERVAQIMAITTPLSTAECHELAQLHWYRERDREDRQLEELRAQQRQLEEEEQRAMWQGDSARTAAARRQLDQVWRQRSELDGSASRAILWGVNQHSIALETVDLHGQRAADVRRIVKEVVRHNTQHWPPYRGGRFLAVFITGHGIHSRPRDQGQRGRAGGRGQRSQPGRQTHYNWPPDALNTSVVREAVEQVLQDHNVQYIEGLTFYCAFFDAPTASEEEAELRG
ncbi:hypothetical protein C2E21_3238 [Chlorella sorokiniana]|uniref:Smr domain-containing protein n=1 Tax=Chlorella sorokiniana TaxID=3076 RepID=A0A2P6TVT9_CHLSO|nr:hypothetical protein C2E21_3238 [Chlorella sorokiniana]|eukprot:PRW58180.1 hypothetical protein C2E21_3238 [Chlorella sorokiniana]